MAKTKTPGEFRTTVGVKSGTKQKLDNNRAPGQCYDGFINQLVDLWEKSADVKRRTPNTRNQASNKQSNV